MLRLLRISNYALIDNVEIEFERGFNVITGETGAGKSIILGALSLLQGGRADSRTVADPNRKSVIEAEFELDGEGDHSLLSDYCRTNDIDWDGERVLLRREIAASRGRSRAFVNDSPVALVHLEEVARHLVDIHSQHHNQLLSQAPFQLAVIDAIAGNGARLAAYRQLFDTLRLTMRSLKTARAELERSRADEEFMRFQLSQIDELRLSPGEQEELERQREVVANIDSLKESMGELLAALNGSDDGEGGAVALVDAATSSARRLTSLLGDELTDRLESASIELNDIASTVADANEELAAQPGLLQTIDQRLGDIYSLERKHHVDTVGELIAIADSLRSRLDAIDNGDEEITCLKRAARRARDLALEAAGEISEHRREAAGWLAGRLREVAQPLGMKNLAVEIRVSDADMSATGTDRVEFLCAFNKNQPLMAVGGAASGGEISRLMLSLKAIIASRMQLPSIIFDEIDTGVSGDVANRMGAMMLDMSANLQVIAITHLPTVAAKGATHFKVFKYDDDDATHTSIRRLGPDERVAEIATMLSGDADSSEARAAARSLISNKS